jgi:hypothetical protein
MATLADPEYVTSGKKILGEYIRLRPIVGEYSKM